MTLHIFNPEHDIALANGQRRITPPHAARQLHADLGFIPAFWADQGDTVLVDDCQHATRAYAKVRMMAKRLFGLETHDVTFRELTSLRDAIPQSIDPWGWDYTLKAILRQHLPKGVQLPSDNELNLIRNMSHRSTALYLLKALRMENTIGEMRLAETQEELLGYVADFQGKAVLKAPWSSSGRGVRFVDGDIDPHMLDWTANVIAKQGGIMVEPMYNRIIDFGMEFTSLGDGTARYAGLSIFTTSHGAYSGNIIATETHKREMLARYIDPSLLDAVRTRVCSSDFSCITSRHQGAFGIDMMIVGTKTGNGYLLHPCVEINLRRTMGHLALQFTPPDDDIEGVMQVVYEGKFKLKLKASTQETRQILI